MGQNPREMFAQLQRMANQAGRGGGPAPKIGGAAAGLLLLVGGGAVLNESLFNVDGGHRAIKYTRIGGVGKEIYSEGMACVVHTA